MEIKTCVSVYNVFIVILCSIYKIKLVSGQETDTETKEDGTNKPVDHHTFVALIDIVFTDGSKRTCTGAIIHDYVVITAAHCFVSDRNKKAKPELTTSFVVIGTKKMFETGYEQYLPIEKVVTHPKFKGWTADLALIYTFAGMTSDKPGTVIALAGDRTSTPVDSNVTVLSWRHSKGDLMLGGKADTRKPKYTPEKCSESNSAEHDNHFHETQTKSLRAGAPLSSEEVKHRHHDMKKHINKVEKNKIPQRITTRTYKSRFRTVKGSQTQRYQIDLEEYKDKSGQFISRYLTSREISNLTKNRVEDLRNHQKKQEEENATLKQDHIKIDPNSNVSKEKAKEEAQIQNIKLTYNNWRRALGPQQNKLTVEVFGFVNMQTCKKVVEKAMPEIYEIKGVTDIVCYASDEHLITTEDSGAPVIRNNQLVAVTVGGTDFEGEHIAVGMKMSCYCSWIANNLPIGSPRLHCCKNCCDVTHVADHTHRSTTSKYKYLL